MQLFLRTLNATTTTLNVDQTTDIQALKMLIEEKEGVPAVEQLLICGTKVLQVGENTLQAAGIENHSTIHISCRLRGGKPVKVKMMTPHLPCGSEVTIDIEPTATKDEIKQKLAPLTGVPVEHQKVMMSGINQIVMGDKRTNVGFSACGETSGVQLAVGNK